MTRLYTARETLYRLARGMGGPVLPSVVNRALDEYEAAVRAAPTAAPVAAPDPSRAVLEDVWLHAVADFGVVEDSASAEHMNRTIDRVLAARGHAARIIAASGTGQGEERAAECERMQEIAKERDAALAKLAEVSESAKAYMEARLGGDTPDMSPFIDRLDDALSRAPSTALAERDARVRKTALEEAAEAWERRVAERAPDFAAGLSHGNVVAGMEEATRFLRSLASRGGGA